MKLEYLLIIFFIFSPGYKRKLNGKLKGVKVKPNFELNTQPTDFKGAMFKL